MHAVSNLYEDTRTQSTGSYYSSLPHSITLDLRGADLLHESSRACLILHLPSGRADRYCATMARYMIESGR